MSTMPAHVTPSPHRFVSTTRQSRPARSEDEEDTRDRSRSKHLETPVAPSSAQFRAPSTQRSSQFATTPRFGNSFGPRASQYSPVPTSRRDHVQDYLDQEPTSESGASPSPSRHPRRASQAYEQIDDIAQNNYRYHQVYQNNTESVPPAAKRRKIPLPPSWAQQGVSERLQLDEVSQGPPAFLTTTTKSRSEQIQPIDPARIDHAPQKGSDTPSPSPARRVTPRFDFSKTGDSTARLTHASSNLQRITGSRPFILPPVETEDDQATQGNAADMNLALLFSPQKHRRYQYAPGGMATTVRDWVLDAAVGIGSQTVVSKFRILDIRPGERGSRLATGVDRLGEEEHYLLLGEPYDSDRKDVEVGKMVVVMSPSWVIELDEPWRVAVKWKIVGDYDHDHG